MDSAFGKQYWEPNVVIADAIYMKQQSTSILTLAVMVKVTVTEAVLIKGPTE
jgi:hypothetical protein